MITSKTLFRIVLPDVAFLDTGFRVEVSCDRHGLAVYVEAVGIMRVGRWLKKLPIPQHMSRTIRMRQDTAYPPCPGIFHAG